MSGREGEACGHEEMRACVRLVNGEVACAWCEVARARREKHLAEARVIELESQVANLTHDLNGCRRQLGTEIAARGAMAKQLAELERRAVRCRDGAPLQDAEDLRLPRVPLPRGEGVLR